MTQLDYDAENGIMFFLFSEKHGDLCVSDEATYPLIEDCFDLVQKKDPAEKIVVLDRMLHRVHQRGNLSALFVEGGASSLDALSE